MRRLLVVLILPLFALLGACNFVGFPGVYRIDVEQGNIVTQEMADQLRPGMSKRQVRFILGTPLVEDTFNPQRWDYIYVRRNGQDILDESRLSVQFEGDNLSGVLGDYQPPAWQDPVQTVDDLPLPDDALEDAAETASDAAETSIEDIFEEAADSAEPSDES